MYKKIIELHKTRFKGVRRYSTIILFSHIPKTAGTSLRKSIEKDIVTINDYGASSSETSEVIKKFIYEDNDPYYLKISPSLKKANWICGHFPLSKYADLVKSRDTVSFVREPVEQVISHYNHHVAYKGYKGSLEQFLDIESWHNIQSKYLNLMPISLIGCVGVTEAFNDSLKIINDFFGLSIVEESHNVNENKAICTRKLDEALIRKVEEYNYQDCQLYEEAKYTLKQRLEFLKAGHSSKWVFGTVEKHAGNVLYGCAFYAKRQSVVVLQILKNSYVIEEVKANQYFSKYTKANFPRERYIGFFYSLPSNSLKEDRFDVVVKETGQKLNYKAIQIM